MWNVIAYERYMAYHVTASSNQRSDLEIDGL